MTATHALAVFQAARDALDQYVAGGNSDTELLRRAHLLMEVAAHVLREAVGAT